MNANEGTWCDYIRAEKECIPDGKQMEAQTAFTVECAGRLLGRTEGSIVSPVSLYQAFGSLASGTEDNGVRDELLKLLHADSIGELEAWCRKTRRSIYYENLAHEEEREIEREAGDDCRSGLTELDLGFDDDTKGVLTSSLSYYGAWKNAFDRGETGMQRFHVDAGLPGEDLDGHTVEMPFMRKTGMGYYADLDECSVTSMGFDDYRNDAVFVLPRGGESAASILADPQKLEKALCAKHDILAEIKLVLPKIHAETVTDVCGICHEAKLKLDEGGIEGAAKTMLSVNAEDVMQPACRIELIFDKPFIYGIRNKYRKDWLYLGVYNG